MARSDKVKCVVREGHTYNHVVSVSKGKRAKRVKVKAGEKLEVSPAAAARFKHAIMPLEEFARIKRMKEEIKAQEQASVDAVEKRRITDLGPDDDDITGSDDITVAIGDEGKSEEAA